MSVEKEFQLVMTCSACPEQYDVFFRGEKVGYMRLRHGYFRVECPKDEVIYGSAPNGADGTFRDKEQRVAFLTIGCEAIKDKLTRHIDPVEDTIYEIVERENAGEDT